MKRIVTVFAALLVTALSASTAHAASIVGDTLIANGGNVIATFLGHTAGFTNDLYLFDASNLAAPLAVTPTTGPGFGGDPGLIFTNQTDIPGTTIDLGAFAPGTELVFGIFVRNTGYIYYMGSGTRNPDGLFHGAVDDGNLPVFPAYGSIPAGSVGVGFEDLFGGGDLDYDDLGFAFSNVRSAQAVPEPASLLLLGSGLLAAARARRRTSGAK